MLPSSEGPGIGDTGHNGQAGSTNTTPAPTAPNGPPKTNPPLSPPKGGFFVLG